MLKRKSGQGTTEYIVILAIVIGFAMVFMNGSIRTAIMGKINQLVSSIGSAG